MTENRESGYKACRCTHCGAPLEIKPGQEIAKCAYCDTVFKVEKAKNEEIVIKNIQNIKIENVNIEKKGLAQSAFEYLDKRAQAREKAEAEERVRKAAEEERKRKTRLKIGEFFLWLYFFPVMLIITLVKHYNEKKEYERLMTNGMPSKNPTPMPTAFMIIGAFIFVCAIGSVGRNRSAYNSGDMSSASVTDELNSSSAASDNYADTQAKWYDNDTLVIQNIDFTEETVACKYNTIQYEIPKKWYFKEDGEMKYYYPFANIYKTFISIKVDDYSNLDSNYFDIMETEELNKSVLNDYYNGMLKGQDIINSNAVPCKLNNFRGIMIAGEYKREDLNTNGALIMTLLCTGNKVISIGTLMANGDENVSTNDYCAVLNSIRLTTG